MGSDKEKTKRIDHALRKAIGQVTNLLHHYFWTALSYDSHELLQFLYFRLLCGPGFPGLAKWPLSLRSAGKLETASWSTLQASWLKFSALWLSNRPWFMIKEDPRCFSKNFKDLHPWSNAPRSGAGNGTWTAQNFASLLHLLGAWKILKALLGQVLHAQSLVKAEMAS